MPELSWKLLPKHREEVVKKNRPEKYWLEVKYDYANACNKGLDSVDFAV